MTNKSGTLYTDVTNDLQRRVYEHKKAIISGFTKRYKIKKLIYFEQIMSIQIAIDREKQIKRWNRSKKMKLINKINSDWKDLSESWFKDYFKGNADPRIGEIPRLRSE
jgi:putative endonuclease